MFVAKGANETPSVTPPVQIYDTAPPPVNIVEEPSHRGFTEALAVTVGEETVTVTGTRGFDGQVTLPVQEIIT